MISAPAAAFKAIGDTVEGTIVEVVLRQRYQWKKAPAKGGPMFWHQGRPQEDAMLDSSGQLNKPTYDKVITLETGIPDPESGDTERRVFIKTKHMATALTKAVVIAGAKRDSEDGLLLGGRLKCTYVADVEGQGANPYKDFEFVYSRPEGGAGQVPTYEEFPCAAYKNELKLQAERSPVSVGQPGAPVAAFAGTAGVTSTAGGSSFTLTNHESSPVLNKRTGSGSAAEALGVKAKQEIEPPF